jgi:Fibronectin type III domain
MKSLFLLPLFLFILVSGCGTVSKVTTFNKSNEIKQLFGQDSLFSMIPPAAKVDSIVVNSHLKKFDIYFNKNFSYIPFREENVEEIYSDVKNFYGKDFADYSFSIHTISKNIEELIPNFYRDKSGYDKSRLPLKRNRPKPIIKNISKPYEPVDGLIDRNILLWPSHGWYYNNRKHRWMWQRARLFQTIEDLGPYSFVIPYLIPMLENAGANVFVPRERDIQTNEVIIDDMSENYFETGTTVWRNGEVQGFAIGNPPYESGVNPFKLGKYRITNSGKKETTEAAWVPEIHATGKYAVYISYNSSENNIDDAHYTVNHLGGSTQFLVNQKIGGGTWLFLGEFKFKKGKDRQTGSVILSNKSSETNKIVSADAVRFGGGMGVIERGGSTSGRPKFAEGSRYWLQFAGMPDTLVYNLNYDTLDYNDDYQNRAEYGNYLYGAPYGPSKDKNVKGLGVPIDLSLAFHTDAGKTKNDTTVGTLSIYSITSIDSQVTFPDGVSRFANRDLADIVQTQVVNDIKAKYDPIWNRRWLWDARYSEATRPNFPSLLLELLSHENFLDTKFNLDPRFRFDVSRSIYKGMLKFLSSEYGFNYVVQPLPVTHFSTEFNQAGDIVLKWKPQLDPLEPTAKPNKYVVYKRIDDGGFDNGTLMDDATFVDKNISPGKIYSYKVAAVNNGGEGFPSEILAACKMNNNKVPVLLINGFDRICGPASIKTNSFSGYLNNIDAGVSDKYDMSYVGEQYDFNPDSKWITDDNPGHGASHSDYEAKVLAGNSFDYPYLHGKSIKENGYSFVSSSNEAVWDSLVDISKYKLIDLILGEQKETHWPKPEGDSINGIKFKTFPKKFQKVISGYLKSGGNIFISGAYIGTDLFSTPADSNDIKFAVNSLKYYWANGYADKLGKVYSIPSSFSNDTLFIKYNTELNDSIYAVEAPDALYPATGGEIFLRYLENHFAAGVGYKKDYGVVAFGFPFETILDEGTRNNLMKHIIDYLIK